MASTPVAMLICGSLICLPLLASPLLILVLSIVIVSQILGLAVLFKLFASLILRYPIFRKLLLLYLFGALILTKTKFVEHSIRIYILMPSQTDFFDRIDKLFISLTYTKSQRG